MEKRIVELEKRIAYLEKFIEELNDVVINQQKQLDKYGRELNRLQTKNQASPIAADCLHDEKPPHY
jgi:uncharacterized coiled-coil protein SlyX